MNATLQIITTTIASEFADLMDVEKATRLALRLVLAAVLGGLLGWQRESRGKEAGLRTHMLVSMGSALFVLGAHQAGVDMGNASRVIQGVIAGVGFLGAGAILKEENNGHAHIRGLTTAAGIWLTAAIGMCAGLGEDTTAIISTVLALLVLSVVPMVSKGKPHEDKDQPQHSDGAEAHASGSTGSHLQRGSNATSQLPPAD